MRIPVNLRFISQITRRQERQMVLADRIHLCQQSGPCSENELGRNFFRQPTLWFVGSLVPPQFIS